MWYYDLALYHFSHFLISFALADFLSCIAEAVLRRLAEGGHFNASSENELVY
jgi:hypothetical protein